MGLFCMATGSHALLPHTSLSRVGDELPMMIQTNRRNHSDLQTNATYCDNNAHTGELVYTPGVMSAAAGGYVRGYGRRKGSVMDKMRRRKSNG